MSRIAIAVLLLLTLATLAPAAEFRLEITKMKADEAFSCPGVSAESVQLMTNKPADIQEEPDAGQHRPLYGKIGSMMIRLHQSSSGGGYDRLILDRNENGSLGDDPVHEALDCTPDATARRFGPIEVLSERKGEPLVYYAESLIYQSGPAAVGQLRFHPGCRLETTVEVNGKKEHIALVDGNGNFKIGDAARDQGCRCPDGPHISYMGDVVLRDADGSGRFAADSLACEHEPLAAYIYFGPTPCTMEVAKDLSSVRIEPYDGPLGEVRYSGMKRVGASTLSRNVSGNQWEAITPHPVDGVAKVPEGKYVLYSCTLKAKGDNGEVYVAQGNKASAKGATELRDKGSITLAMGAPIEIKVTADRQVSGGLLALFSAPTVRISAEMVGAGGEAYRQFQRGSEQLSPPKFRVLDEDGKELASGQLEYG